MLTPLLGIATIAFVVWVALTQHPDQTLGFFSWHAGVVVFGGVLGALLIAVDRRSLMRMLISVRHLLPSGHEFTREIHETVKGLDKMRRAWREGRRAEILDMADNAANIELRVAAEALLQQLPPAAVAERFMELKTDVNRKMGPVIEGWEMVGKLAPSFGMVGTVTGMVQMFKNMAGSVENIGGSMALALLATLYGITTGAAVGGPMASRLSNQLNEKLDMLDFLEGTVAALIEENTVTEEGA